MKGTRMLKKYFALFVLIIVTPIIYLKIVIDEIKRAFFNLCIVNTFKFEIRELYNIWARDYK
jgi:hypothetical protein